MISRLVARCWNQNSVTRHKSSEKRVLTHRSLIFWWFPEIADPNMWGFSKLKTHMWADQKLSAAIGPCVSQ